MGCTVSKHNKIKLNETSALKSDDMKIQTVFQLDVNESKLLKDIKSISKIDHCNRLKNNEQKVKRKTDTLHKSPKTKHEKSSKPTYDLKIITKYDMKGVIGKGSCSRVLRVEHRISKVPYALKIIEVPSGREAFEAEISVLRRLNHPNVIKLIEVFESNHQMYMIMDLATGGSLLDRLEAKGCLDEDESRDVIMMVLRGVQYLHSLGITHRDLKPDNLLYYHPGKESRLMITDFSFASTRKPSGSQYMHTICGTPQYIAPEVVLHKPYTSIVDVWAVGIVTYIVLCGSFPFDANVDTHIFKLILQGHVDMSGHLWGDVSEACKSFVRQLLCTAPERRPCASAALKHAWMRCPAPASPRSARSSADSRSVAGSIASIRASGRRRVRVQRLDLSL